MTLIQIALLNWDKIHLEYYIIIILLDYYYVDKFKSCVKLQKATNDCSLLHINVRSLPKNYDILQLCLANLDFSFDIIGLTETWLNKDIADLYKINTYNHIYRCGEKQKGGGVSLYLNPHLVYKERHDIEKHFTSSAEVLIIETCQTVIACVYRP